MFLETRDNADSVQEHTVSLSNHFGSGHAGGKIVGHHEMMGCRCRCVYCMLQSFPQNQLLLGGPPVRLENIFVQARGVLQNATSVLKRSAGSVDFRSPPLKKGKTARMHKSIT